MVIYVYIPPNPQSKSHIYETGYNTQRLMSDIHEHWTYKLNSSMSPIVAVTLLLVGSKHIIVFLLHITIFQRMSLVVSSKLKKRY